MWDHMVLASCLQTKYQSVKSTGPMGTVAGWVVWRSACGMWMRPPETGGEGAAIGGAECERERERGFLAKDFVSRSLAVRGSWLQITMGLIALIAMGLI